MRPLKGACKEAVIFICGKKVSIVRLSVPIQGGQSLKRSLLKHLMKLAGISEEEI
jgi:hypothetical protein